MKNKNKITVYVDSSCDMASVHLNGKCIMSGNYWDFHPGCHGIYKYGDFKGYNGLVNAIKATIGGEFEISIEKYKSVTNED